MVLVFSCPFVAFFLCYLYAYLLGCTPVFVASPSLIMTLNKESASLQMENWLRIVIRKIPHRREDYYFVV